MNDATDIDEMPFQWPELPRDPARYYYRVNWWYCGDDICDCNQPQLERIYVHETEGKNHWARPKREIVLTGPWYSIGGYGFESERWHAMKAWQVRAARRYQASNLRDIEAEFAKHMADYRPTDYRAKRPHEKPE